MPFVLPVRVACQGLQLKLTLFALQWVNHTPEGTFPVVCNGDRYAAMVRSQGGETALQQWKLLEDKMRPLQQGAALFPAAALRSDPGITV